MAGRASSCYEEEKSEARVGEHGEFCPRAGEPPNSCFRDMVIPPHGRACFSGRKRRLRRHPRTPGGCGQRGRHRARHVALRPVGLAPRRAAVRRQERRGALDGHESAAPAGGREAFRQPARSLARLRLAGGDVEAPWQETAAHHAPERGCGRTARARIGHESRAGVRAGGQGPVHRRVESVPGEAPHPGAARRRVVQPLPGRADHFVGVVLPEPGDRPARSRRCEARARE